MERERGQAMPEGAAGALDAGREASEPWLRQAEHDLETARFARDAGRHALACFLCQQSAEKGVTAYLIARGPGAVSLDRVLKID